MFDRLQNKFSKIFSVIKGHGKISEKNISEAWGKTIKSAEQNSSEIAYKIVN